MYETRDNIPENTNIQQPEQNVQSWQGAGWQPGVAQVMQPQSFPQYGAPGTPFTPYQAVKVEKKPTEFTALELGYSFGAFLLLFLLIRYAMCSPTGFITTAVFVALFAAGLIFMSRSGRKADGRVKLTAGIGILFSAVYSITANEFIKALDSIFLCLLFIWLLDRMGSEDRRIPRFLPFVMVKAVLDRPLSSMGLMPEAVGQTAKKTKLGKNIVFVVIGLIAAVIPTMIVGSLLMSADSGVEKMLGSIVEYLLSEKLVAVLIQLALAVPLGCYVFGLMFSSLHRDEKFEVTDDGCEVKLASARKLQNMVIYAAVTPICLLYLLFFIS
ncbi:MAG: hypothetical protein IJ723_05895 [Ruminococcus sp.]|nr:hypothetical protein [Ruminococcus sp.]